MPCHTCHLHTTRQANTILQTIQKAARLQQERRMKDVQEEKRPKKSTRVENVMEKYLEMRIKQAEDESAQLVKEKKHTQGADFSIKKCISVLRSMEVTKEEKAKAYSVLVFSRHK
jgi:hypothetical protein